MVVHRVVVHCFDVGDVGHEHRSRVPHLLCVEVGIGDVVGGERSSILPARGLVEVETPTAGPVQALPMCREVWKGRAFVPLVENNPVVDVVTGEVTSAARGISVYVVEFHRVVGGGDDKFGNHSLFRSSAGGFGLVLLRRPTGREGFLRGGTGRGDRSRWAIMA